MKIPITKTVLGDRECELIQEPLKSGWVVQGPFVKQFEDKFMGFTKSNQALACTSCTTGMHLALAALGIGPGDEVIVPAFTWVATANVVLYVGATPVFCDISLDTFNIDPSLIEDKITDKTKAIIPVHLFGLPADMNPIMAIAKKHNLFVIEDAACGFGSWYNGQHVGTIGDFGVFSFHPRKAITTGEGGMVITATKERADLCRCLRDHGASKTDLKRHNEKSAFLLPQFNLLGFNYRMTDMQGAVGVAQMERAAWIQEKRTFWAEKYDERLANIDWLRRPARPEGSVHGFQSYVCLFAPEKPSLSRLSTLNDQRNHLMTVLEENGVSTRQGTHAVIDLGYYKNEIGINPEDYPNALMAEKLSLTLPLYAQMTEEEHLFVINQIERVYASGLCAA